MNPDVINTLDAIADSVNPGLVLLTLFVAWRYRAREGVVPWALVMTTVTSLIFVYVIQYADTRFGLWPSLGLDYSTHTAFAVAVVTSLALYASKLLWVLLPLLLLYAALMMYLDYHTLADILTSAFVIASLVFVIHYLILGKVKPSTTRDF